MLKQALKRTQKVTGTVMLESVRQAGRQAGYRENQISNLFAPSQTAASTRDGRLGQLADSLFLLAGLELARRRVDAGPRLSVCTALDVCARVMVPVGVCVCDKQREGGEGKCETRVAM
jgi:hypothetical protein